jgi:hypothetical protein
MGPKILILDIETSPHLVYTWGHRDQNIGLNQVVRDSYVLMYCAKWLDSEEIISDSLPDHKSYYKKNPHCDKKVAESAWKLFDEADIIVAHNGDRFDIKWLRFIFLKHNMVPPSDYMTVDTLKQSRANFYLPTHSLDNLGKQLTNDRKMKHSGFDLWTGCMNGNEESWATMLEYCKQDVRLLEEVYLKILPYMKNHPNHGLYRTNLYDGTVCKNCGSNRLRSKGQRTTRAGRYRRYQCNDCGSNLQGTENLMPKELRKSMTK